MPFGLLDIVGFETLALIWVMLVLKLALLIS